MKTYEYGLININEKGDDPYWYEREIIDPTSKKGRMDLRRLREKCERYNNRLKEKKAKAEEIIEQLKSGDYLVDITAPGYEDSCGGFIGDDSVLQEAYRSLAEAIISAEKERANAADAAARGIVTV